MEKSSSCRTLATVAGGCAALVCTSLITLYVARTYYAADLCAMRVPTVHFEKERPVFHEGVEVHMAERGVTVKATDDKCLIMPLSKGEDRVLHFMHEPLSRTMLEELAGIDGVRMCHGLPAHLLVDPLAREAQRVKRQEPIGSLDDGGPNDGTELEYEERSPRCMDLILDCATESKIGEVQSCFTWMNGIMRMTQRCNSAQSFQIYMKKPKERILKLAQRQSKVCAERRGEGLRC